jgi:hypothetical protein
MHIIGKKNHLIQKILWFTRSSFIYLSFFYPFEG